MVIKMAEFPQEGSRYSKRSRMAEDRRRREGPEGQMQAAMPKFADGLRQRDLQMETHPRRTLSGRLVLAWAEVSDFKLDLMLHPRSILAVSRDLDKSRAEFAPREGE